MPTRLGLTGGLASGKSLVASILADLGADVIDTDEISHRLAQPGSPMVQAMAEAFGADLLDAEGRLDRKALGARVFADPSATARLNAITHPKILAEMQRQITASTRPVVVLVVPLLLESGADRLVDEVWLVVAPEGTRLNRVYARDGLTEEQARDRMQRQWTDDRKREKAHVIIENSGTPEDLRQRVQEAWDALQERRR